MHAENETWIVERGAKVIEKKAQSGPASLNDWERLVYCLWVTDYMMRNAGDLANAVDMYPNFQSDAKQLATQLALSNTLQMFSLSKRSLQQQYYDRFDKICAEIRNANPATESN
jgi:hypothetical protein